MPAIGRNTFDRGDGYVDPFPEAGASQSTALPVVPTVIPANHFLVVEEEKVVVFNGTNGLVKLRPATGSGRVHTIIHSGHGTLTVDAGPWNFIIGRQVQTMHINSSMTLLDRSLFNWSIV